MNDKKNPLCGENGTLSPGCTSSAEEHTFKKARYAWQIKGHHNSEGKFKHHGENGEHSMSNDKGSATIELRDMHESVGGHMHESVGCNTEEMPANNGISELDMHEDMLTDNPKMGDKNICTIEHYESNNSQDLNVGSMEKCNDQSMKDLKSEMKVDSMTHKRKNVLAVDENEPKNKKPALAVDLAGSSSDGRRANAEALGRVSNSVLSYQGFDLASFLWQKQEMGCAIVDNVFNRTLEEMGLSPDPKVNVMATARLAVVNHSIETAIRNQGLRAARSEDSRVLDNMEELQRRATLTDFENTQLQLRTALERGNLTSTVNMYRDYPILTSVIQNGEVIETNGKLEGQRQSSYHFSQHTGSIRNVKESDIDQNLEHEDIDSDNDTSNEDSEFEEEEENSYEGEFEHKHRNNENCITDNRHNETTERGLTENMDISDSSGHNGKRDSDNILDLAVSTAILSQGLTYNASH